MRECAVEDCERKHYGLGFCATHYEYFRKHGTPVHVPLTALERFWAKVAEPDDQGCRLWTGHINKSGIGKFNPDGKTVGAHRWIYIQIHGEPPEGLVVDHVCHNIDMTCLGGPTCKHRHCMTVEHMELKTIAENTRAGVWSRWQPSVCKIEGCVRVSRAQEMCNTHYERWKNGRDLLSPIRRTHCREGHLLEESNVYLVSDGERRCRICIKTHGFERHRRKKERLQQELREWVFEMRTR